MVTKSCTSALNLETKVHKLLYCALCLALADFIPFARRSGSNPIVWTLHSRPVLRVTCDNCGFTLFFDSSWSKCSCAGPHCAFTPVLFMHPCHSNNNAAHIRVCEDGRGCGLLHFLPPLWGLPDNGGRKRLWNVGLLLRDCTRATFLKTVIFIVTSIRTWNLTLWSRVIAVQKICVTIDFRKMRNFYQRIIFMRCKTTWRLS
jgi:hypothetical protein